MLVELGIINWTKFIQHERCERGSFIVNEDPPVANTGFSMMSSHRERIYLFSFLRNHVCPPIPSVWYVLPVNIILRRGRGEGKIRVLTVRRQSARKAYRPQIWSLFYRSPQLPGLCLRLSQASALPPSQMTPIDLPALLR